MTIEVQHTDCGWLARLPGDSYSGVIAQADTKDEAIEIFKEMYLSVQQSMLERAIVMEIKEPSLPFGSSPAK